MVDDTQDPDTLISTVLHGRFAGLLWEYEILLEQIPDVPVTPAGEEGISSRV